MDKSIKIAALAAAMLVTPVMSYADKNSDVGIGQLRGETGAWYVYYANHNNGGTGFYVDAYYDEPGSKGATFTDTVPGAFPERMLMKIDIGKQAYSGVNVGGLFPLTENTSFYGAVGATQIKQNDRWLSYSPETDILRVYHDTEESTTLSASAGLLISSGGMSFKLGVAGGDGFAAGTVALGVRF